MNIWLDVDCRRLFLPNRLDASTYESLLTVPKVLKLDIPTQRSEILRNQGEMGFLHHGTSEGTMAIIHNNMAVFFPSRPASIPEAWPLPLSIIATHALLLVGQALLDLQTASTLSTHRVAPIYHCPSLFRQLSAIMKQVQHLRVSIANLATLVIVSVLSINTSAVPICEQTKVFHVEAKAMRTLSFKNREANRLLLIEGTAIVLSTHLAGQRSRLILIDRKSVV